MVFKKLKDSVHWHVYVIFSFFLFVCITGCGGGDGIDYPNDESGSAIFSIIWSEETPDIKLAQAIGNPTIDCLKKQISTVSVVVYDGQSGSHLTGKAFACEDGGGTIDNIPAGKNRRFVISGKDSSGTVVYEGENREIPIKAGVVTDIGYIVMARLNPPTITVDINNPPDKSVFLEDEPITFNGSWYANEGDITFDDVVWASDIDGEIGRDETFTLPLSSGRHIITLTVQDEEGAKETAVITILVGVPSSLTVDPGITLNFIPKGNFVMGSPRSESGWLINDETQHKVTLTRSFYIQTTEITQGQWKTVMGDNPSWFLGCGEDCPVERVSWYDCVLFCNRLSMLEELTPCYYTDADFNNVYIEKSITGDSVYWKEDTNGYRLPTEAEWEYAARAGSTTAFFSGSMKASACNFDSNLDEAGLYCGNSEVAYSGCFDAEGWGGPVCSGPYPVGSKEANAWGLYDMHGNVLEWCQDWYDSYSLRKLTDPVGPVYGSARVLRGGAWSKGVKTCRSASRDKMPPIIKNSNNGFRIARFPG